MVRDRSFFNVVEDVLIHVILFAFAMATLMPILYVLVMSFSRTNDLTQLRFGFAAYRYIFSAVTLPRAMLVTVYITVIGTAVSLLLTAFMAYALSSKQLLGRNVFMFMVVFTMMFGGGIIPTYFVVRSTGLLNSLWSLIIPSAINSFNLIVLRNFFMAIPDELEESAVIDGCHELTILFRIILPLSMAAMAAFGLFYAVAKWNTWFAAIIYIQEPAKWPIQVLLRQVVFVSTGIGDSSMSSDVNMTFTSDAIRSAVIVVSTLPILLVYPFLQKHFTKGILLGSVKG
jgi:putative aldouronate transport system permease protein